MSLSSSDVQAVSSLESLLDENFGTLNYSDESDRDQLRQGKRRGASPAVVGGRDFSPKPAPANDLHDLSQLQPTPKCLSPTDIQNPEATDIEKCHMDVGEAELLHDVKISEEVLVLDEVGVCEEMAPGVHQPGGAPEVTVANLGRPNDASPKGSIRSQATSTTYHGSCSYYKVQMMETDQGTPSSDEPKELPPSNGIVESDDDILSIMCEDNEDDILLDGDDPSAKREWTFESRCASKRNRDSQNTPRPSDLKRIHSSFKNPSESNGRQRNGPVHSRLGKPKYYQSIREFQRPCYNFAKTGNCFRASCQFLHSAPSQDALKNRSGHNVDDSILGTPPPYHLLALQRQLREQQLQLQQQNAQHQALVEHVYQNELHLKQYAASKANQVLDKTQESLRSLQEQQDQQDQICQLVQHLNSLEDRVRELECAQCTRQDLLTHYQFIADFQQHQLQQLIGDQAGSLCNDKITGGRQSCLPLPDLRQLPPLRNSGPSCPPRPRSADLENQQCSAWNVCPPSYAKPESSAQRPRSADNLHPTYPEHFAPSHPLAGLHVPLQPHHEHPQDTNEGHKHDWDLGGTIQRLSSISRSPVDPSFHHAASGSRVVRILPLRHTPSLDEYQQPHLIHQPSSRGM